MSCINRLADFVDSFGSRSFVMLPLPLSTLPSRTNTPLPCHLPSFRRPPSLSHHLNSSPASRTTCLRQSPARPSPIFIANNVPLKVPLRPRSSSPIITEAIHTAILQHRHHRLPAFSPPLPPIPCCPDDDSTWLRPCSARCARLLPCAMMLASVIATSSRRISSAVIRSSSSPLQRVRWTLDRRRRGRSL